MSRQTYTHEGFTPERKGWFATPWTTQIWVMVLTGLLLVVLSVVAVTSLNGNKELQSLADLEALNAGSDFIGLNGVAAVRAADAAASATGDSYARQVLQHEGRDVAANASFGSLNGVAAVRAADAAASATGDSYARQVLQHEGRDVAARASFGSLNGVAAVRAADAAEFSGLQGVAAVRAVDAR